MKLVSIHKNKIKETSENDEEQKEISNITEKYENYNQNSINVNNKEVSHSLFLIVFKYMFDNYYIEG